MDEIEDPTYIFGWQAFAEGRARFAGLERGVDEAGHNSLAVDLDGTVSYGEIAIESAASRNRYALVVLSMGWSSRSILGAPLCASGVRHFSPSQMERVQRLIVQLVEEFVTRDKRPGFLIDMQEAFTGDVRFADDWCFVTNERVS